jgi:hypothetical protein
MDTPVEQSFDHLRKSQQVLVSRRHSNSEKQIRRRETTWAARDFGRQRRTGHYLMERATTHHWRMWSLLR